MRRVVDVVRDLLLRMLPHPTRPGLRRIGSPGPESPVLLTGNFALTVRRLAKTLSGYDVWLLLANSNGINVWCAAAGGHLTHHDVIAAIRSSGIESHVAHRTIVLPQLAASGVERRVIAERTGWESRWGPAQLADLPAYLDRGLHIRNTWRAVRFPLRDRLEMAAIWMAPMALVTLLVVGLVIDGLTGMVAGAIVAVSVPAIFAAIPWIPVVGPRRWLTYGGAAVVSFGVGATILAAWGSAATSGLIALGVVSVAFPFVLSVDMAGTTPWYPSTINSFRNHFDIELDTSRCNGSAECVQVCPRNVLWMMGRERQVEIRDPDACIRCGACIVQCPEDALRFRFRDGRVVEAPTVRATRLNMLGRRAVEIEES
jgi:ferredoxin